MAKALLQWHAACPHDLAAPERVRMPPSGFWTSCELPTRAGGTHRPVGEVAVLALVGQVEAAHVADAPLGHVHLQGRMKGKSSGSQPA